MEKNGRRYEKEKTMTLFKQMTMVVSLIIIIMLALVMAINYQSAKKDMIQNIYETNVNSIASLASNLSHAKNEKAQIRTVIDAAFDSGYYQSIEFHSNKDSFTYRQEDKDPVANVPSWFINFTDIEIQSIKEDVSSGWQILGEVIVMGDTRIIYQSLYAMFLKLMYLFVGFVLLAQVVLGVMFYFILKPLKKIQLQAEAITNNEFLIQKEIPYTTEFREVVKGMNSMVQKVEEIFIKGNEAAKHNQELLYNDPITKLYNRRYLMLKLPDLITLENSANGGTILFVAIKGAELLNQALGREEADKMFYKFGILLKDVCKEFEYTVIARMNGTEFTIMIPDCEANESVEIANSIHYKYEQLLKEHKFDINSVTLNIGMYRYKSNVKISELLTRADNALTQAKAEEFSNTYIYEEKDDENAMGKEQWREIIEESIAKKQFTLKFLPMIDSQTGDIEHNVMTFTIDDGREKYYSYGDFIAPVINLGLVHKVYIVALRELIIRRHHELDGTLCSIRLSNEFMKDPLAFEALSNLLKEHGKFLSFKLSFEISDNFAIKNTAVVKSFVELFKAHGSLFGLNSFTGESYEFSYLKELHPSFIKADVSFLLDQSKNSMSALQVITDSLGIEIIATYVQTQEELQRLNDLHIYKVQGAITESLQK